MKTALIGIDIGSTNTKCVAIKPSGEIIASRTSGRGGRLFNAVTLYSIVRQALLLLAGEIKGYNVAGVAVTSVGCELIALDKNDRQIKLADPPRDYVVPGDCRAVTGYGPRYQNGGRRLAYSISQAPELAGQICKIFSVGDYISYRLCGEQARDLSLAGSTSTYDRQNGGWWRRYLELTGLDPKSFGAALKSGTAAGRITKKAAEETGLPQGTAVILGGHDYLSSALACGCIDNRRIFNVLGTYEMVASFGDVFAVAKTAEFEVFSDIHTFPGRFSTTSEILSAGQLEWLRRNLFSGGGAILSEKRWAALFRSLDSLADIHPEQRGGERFFPLCEGSGAGLENLTPASGAASVLRAAIDGLSLFSVPRFEYLELSNKEAVVTTGGGSRSRYWLQTKSDILGKPIVVPGIPESAASGAALLAGVGAGIYAGFEEACAVYSGFPASEYQPREQHHQYYKWRLTNG